MSELYVELGNMDKRFQSFNGEFAEFERVEHKRSASPDIHAMLLLEELFPTDNGSDMIRAAEHDTIYFRPSEEQLLTLSQKHILELTRCGISYSEYDYLYSFV